MHIIISALYLLSTTLENQCLPLRLLFYLSLKEKREYKKGKGMMIMIMIMKERRRESCGMLDCSPASSSYL